MKKLEHFAIQHPIAFGLLLILLFSLLSTLTWPITQIYPYPEGYEVSTAVAKLLIAGCFILLLWGFGWLRTAGYLSLGRTQIWPLVIGLIIYNAIFGVFAHTLSFRIGLPPIKLTIAILFFSSATSLVEETMYRGLLLTAMVKAWGSNPRGLYAAALLSGFTFASLHFLNLIIRPFPVVAMQVISMTMVGFVYAAIVLASRSIWPVIVFHWLVNASVNLQASLNPNFEETTTGWAIFTLVMLPIVIVGNSLMQKVVLKNGFREGENYHDNQFETILH